MLGENLCWLLLRLKGFKQLFCNYTSYTPGFILHSTDFNLDFLQITMDLRAINLSNLFYTVFFSLQGSLTFRGIGKAVLITAAANSQYKCLLKLCIIFFIPAIITILSLTIFSPGQLKNVFNLPPSDFNGFWWSITLHFQLAFSCHVR